VLNVGGGGRKLGSIPVVSSMRNERRTTRREIQVEKRIHQGGAVEKDGGIRLANTKDVEEKMCFGGRRGGKHSQQHVSTAEERKLLSEGKLNDKPTGARNC